MKTLYLDCSMGAAGDMLTAALIELLPDPSAFCEKLNNIGIPDVHFENLSVLKNGIKGTHMKVTVHGDEEGEENHGHTHEHEHEHRGMREIEEIIDNLTIPENVKNDVLSVYKIIAGAESHVHGTPVSEIHFHEVGMMDAVADITAVCLLMNEIKPDRVIASPVHVGSGTVRCSHAVLPVPTPATAYILNGCPVYGGEIKSELCTPTGAALLKHFTDEFGDMPLMKIVSTGFGMGKKDFERLNCVRAILGDEEEKTDTVTELECNIDDMTAEELSFACERIFEAGAVEVFTMPCSMKKNRQGQVLRVICKESDKEKVISSVFRFTSTIGIREYCINRYTLERKINFVETPCGAVREKVSQGFGVKKQKYEFDDLSKIAKENNMTLSEVRKIADESK